MPYVKRKINSIQERKTDLTEDQHKLYLENEDKFWDLFYDELQFEEYVIDEKIFDEDTSVEEQEI